MDAQLCKNISGILGYLKVHKNTPNYTNLHKILREKKNNHIQAHASSEKKNRKHNNTQKVHINYIKMKKMNPLYCLFKVQIKKGAFGFLEC